MAKKAKKAKKAKRAKKPVKRRKSVAKRRPAAKKSGAKKKKPARGGLRGPKGRSGGAGVHVNKIIYDRGDQTSPLSITVTLKQDGNATGLGVTVSSSASSTTGWDNVTDAAAPDDTSCTCTVDRGTVTCTQTGRGVYSISEA